MPSLDAITPKSIYRKKGKPTIRKRKKSKAVYEGKSKAETKKTRALGLNASGSRMIIREEPSPPTLDDLVGGEPQAVDENTVGSVNLEEKGTDGLFVPTRSTRRKGKNGRTLPRRR